MIIDEDRKRKIINYILFIFVACAYYSKNLILQIITFILSYIYILSINKELINIIMKKICIKVKRRD